MTFMRFTKGGALESVGPFGPWENLGDVDRMTDRQLSKKILGLVTKSPITPELYEEILFSLVPIKFGIAPNGFDTNSVSEEFIEEMELRCAPRGCWSLYASDGGRAYRAYCSSRERNQMQKDYENNQRILQVLHDNGFQDLDLKDDASLLLKNMSESSTAGPFGHEILDAGSETLSEDEDMTECPDCGRVWDGYAQCYPCPGLEMNELEEATKVEDKVEEHPSGWTEEHHYGMCGQSCPCCRAIVEETDFGVCTICRKHK